MMEKEFIPYELALELKQLGFDEPCLKFYVDKKLILGLDTDNGDTNSKLNQYNSLFVSAPTYSQAFRWFREVHDLHCYTERFQDGEFDYTILSDLVEEEVGYGDGPFQTYEEAELACLKKLIEIVNETYGGNK